MAGNRSDRYEIPCENDIGGRNTWTTSALVDHSNTEISIDIHGVGTEKVMMQRV